MFNVIAVNYSELSFYFLRKKTDLVDMSGFRPIVDSLLDTVVWFRVRDTKIESKIRQRLVS